MSLVNVYQFCLSSKETAVTAIDFFFTIATLISFSFISVLIYMISFLLLILWAFFLSFFLFILIGLGIRLSCSFEMSLVS